MLLANKTRRSDKAKYQVFCEIAFVSSSLPPRFLLKVAFQSNGCWIWTGSVFANPRYPHVKYGQFQQYFGRENGRSLRRTTVAHKIAYEAMVGPVPQGLDLDHLCEVKLCVNPEHLEPVTRSENMLRVFRRRAK